MKNTRIFSLISFVCTAILFGAFFSGNVLASTPTEHIVECTYNETESIVEAKIYISKGTAIVGYCSIDYDQTVLDLIDASKNMVPKEVPTRATYLKEVVSSYSGVVVTNVGKTSNKLVNTEQGYVLFAWYLPESSSYVDATKSKVHIATISFKLKDSKTLSDIKDDCIAFASSEITDTVGNWYPGILVVSSNKNEYKYFPGSTTNNTNASVVYNFDSSDDIPAIEVEPEQEPEQEPEKEPEQESEQEPEKEPEQEPEKEPEQESKQEPEQEPEEPEQEPEQEPEESENTDVDTSKLSDISVSCTVNSTTVKVKWDSPENAKTFTVRLLDKNGNVVKSIDGISEISDSCTFKDLVSGMEFVAEVYSFSADSKALGYGKSDVKTDDDNQSTALPELVFFTVKYDAGMGTIYGFESENVIFGKGITKVPDVIPPRDEYFAGWSLDAENIVDTDKIRVYNDITLYALYTTTKPADTVSTYMTGYEDKTFKPDGKVTRAELCTLAARLSGKFDENGIYTSNFTDVKQNEWYSNYVGFCAEQEIVSGYEDGSFKPGDYVTRAEFAAIVCRLYGFEYSDSQNYFPDTQSHWAKQYINALYKENATDVQKGQSFRPDQKITRLEAVIILNAAQKRAPDKNAIDEYIRQNGIPFGDVAKPDDSFYQIFEAAVQYK